VKIRRFEAADMREAIAQIKAELGPDALVVSSRVVRRGLLGEGVEVTAAMDDEEDPVRSRVGAATAELDDARIAQLERATAAMQLELRSLRSLMKSLKLPVSDDHELASEVRNLRRIVHARGAERMGCSLDAAVGVKRPLVAAPERPVTVLVGATGVGKTTTVAKLAATRALVAGDPARIISLDMRRAGGSAQIGAFADAMGVRLTSVSDAARLADAVGEVAANEHVYVDTPGCGPRDRELIRGLGRGLSGVGAAEVHLVVPAGMHGASIDQCADRFSDLGIHRLVFTKVDEAAALAELVRAPSRLSIPVSYLTTGQRVPEDIEQATEARLEALSAGTTTLAENVA
jgi:flagellar biosynthesis protein FlhF